MIQRILPSSADQCILGNVYLRSNLFKGDQAPETVLKHPRKNSAMKSNEQCYMCHMHVVQTRCFLWKL